MTEGLTRPEKLLRALVAAFAVSLPISISIAEAALFLALPFWLVMVWRRRDRSFLQHPFLWPVLAFAGLAVFSILWSLHPSISLHRSHRLFLLASIFMITMTVSDGESGVWRAKGLVGLFILGSSILGLFDLVRIPFQVMRGVALFDTGNMRDPQMYMVSLCFLVAIWKRVKWPWPPWSFYPVFLLNAAGLILHFKRGVWFSFILAGLLLAFLSGRRKIAVTVVLCALCMLLVPQVRERLLQINRETQDKYGGRSVLWMQVAPAIIKDHPQGIGYAAATRDDFLKYAKRIQPRLNHLHNNILQVTLELGWLGLCIWLFWMGIALRLFWLRYVHFKQTDREWSYVLLGGLAGFCGLLFNGMVEYNFGDSEILMLICFLMGIASVGQGCDKEGNAV